MTTMTPSIKQIALGDLDQEFATTRRVLEKVPEEHLGWKPHEKSMTLGALAGHISNILRWQVMMVERDGFDVSAPQPRNEPPASRQEILETFDANVATFKATLEGATDTALSQPWRLHNGDKDIFTLPRVAVLRTMGLSHLAHHRGQLSVYLRMLDVPVPSIYGPSADERVF